MWLPLFEWEGWATLQGETHKMIHSAGKRDQIHIWTGGSVLKCLKIAVPCTGWIGSPHGAEPCTFRDNYLLRFPHRALWFREWSDAIGDQGNSPDITSLSTNGTCRPVAVNLPMRRKPKNASRKAAVSINLWSCECIQPEGILIR